VAPAGALVAERVGDGTVALPESAATIKAWLENHAFGLIEDGRSRLPSPTRLNHESSPVGSKDGLALWWRLLS